MTGGNDDYGYDYGEDYPELNLPTMSRADKKCKRFNELWAGHSSLIKDWFLEAFSFGEPDPTLKAPYNLEPNNCNCEKRLSAVDIYMLHSCEYYRLTAFYIFSNA